MRNVGGIYETPKSIEQAGDVYEPTPKNLQKDAVAFLNKQLFETPNWLFDKSILNKFSNPISSEMAGSVQTNILSSLISSTRMNRMVISANRFGNETTYAVDDMLNDVKKGVWSELTTKKPIDNLRRNLQKYYVETLIGIVNPATTGGVTLSFSFSPFGTAPIKNTDVPSIARAHLTALRSQILAAIPGTTDKLSKYHLQDVAERIRRALDPK